MAPRGMLCAAGGLCEGPMYRPAVEWEGQGNVGLPISIRVIHRLLSE